MSKSEKKNFNKTNSFLLGRPRKERPREHTEINNELAGPRAGTEPFVHPVSRCLHTLFRGQEKALLGAHGMLAAEDPGR